MKAKTVKTVELDLSEIHGFIADGVRRSYSMFAKDGDTVDVSILTSGGIEIDDALYAKVVVTVHSLE